MGTRSRRSAPESLLAMLAVVGTVVACAPTTVVDVDDGASVHAPPTGISAPSPIPSAEPTAAATAPEGDPRPVELAGASLAFESIDRKFANPGALVQTEDGRLHVLATRFNAFGGPSEVDHLVSDDGAAWEMVGPVLSTADVPFSEHTVTAASLVSTGEVWVLYFEAVQRPSGPASIGRATAPSLDGPWSVDPAPVLEAGPDDAFDADAVRDPSVLHDGDGWRMWYVGIRDGASAIGLATSTDGVVWQRQPEPVFTGAQTWDAGDVSGARVVARDGELVMAYDNATRGASEIGLAVSTDGTDWTPLAANPVVERDHLGGTFFQFRMIELTDGDLLLLVEAGHGGATDVHQVRITVPQRPR